MQDVVLSEAAPAAAAGAGTGAVGARPGSADAPNPPRTPRRRLSVAHRRLVAGAGVLVLLAVAAVDAEGARREAITDAQLATIPGILAPLDRPVAPRWTSDVSLLAGQTTASGRLVGVDSKMDGSADVVGLDPATGSQAWRAAVRTPGRVVDWVSCTIPEAADARVVACVVADEVAITAETTNAYVYAPVRSRLIVLDAATGVERTNVSVSPSTTVAAWGEDLLLTTVDQDGQAEVRRTDVFDSSRLWTFVVPGVVPMDDFRQRTVTVSVTDGLIVVDAGTSYILNGDGTVLTSWAPDPATTPNGTVAVLDAGRLIAEPTASTASAETGAATAMTRVTDRESGQTVTVHGATVRPTVDDGSLDHLVLAQDARNDLLIASDRTSGKVLWTARGTGAGQVMVLAGRVIRYGDLELESLDGRTGAVGWSTPVRASSRSSLLTDGRLVLVTERDAQGATMLGAYGVDDGLQRWRVAVAPDLMPRVIGAALYGAPTVGVVGLS